MVGKDSMGTDNDMMGAEQWTVVDKSASGQVTKKSLSWPEK